MRTINILLICAKCCSYSLYTTYTVNPIVCDICRTRMTLNKLRLARRDLLPHSIPMGPTVTRMTKHTFLNTRDRLECWFSLGLHSKQVVEYPPRDPHLVPYQGFVNTREFTWPFPDGLHKKPFHSAFSETAKNTPLGRGGGEFRVKANSYLTYENQFCHCHRSEVSNNRI